MNIRDATSADYEKVYHLFEDVWNLSPFRDNNSMQMDENVIRRSFMLSTSMPNFFAQVVEESSGHISGLMTGVVSENFWGVRIAMDTFTYSEHHTDKLIVGFLAWAKRNGATHVQIGEVTGKTRYQRLLNLLGFTEVSRSYLAEI